MVEIDLAGLLQKNAGLNEEFSHIAADAILSDIKMAARLDRIVKIRGLGAFSIKDKETPHGSKYKTIAFLPSDQDQGRENA